MNLCVNSDDKHETGECLPDACGNDEREAKLIKRQRRDDGRNFVERAIDRDRNLIIACVVLVLLMNISTGRYVLYPFMIFSTWVHEMCHGLSAIMMGGYVASLKIYKDGGGLAMTGVSGQWRAGFVSSAGYPGTAVTGCLLLLFRRTTLGPTIGTIGLGFAMLLSCALYVRNTFGLIMLSGEGVFLIIAAWLLPAVWLDNLYNFLAATCCLNAVTSIRALFAAGQGYVNGQAMNSDAHSVADNWGLNYRFWAAFWLILSIVSTVIGIVFAWDARELSWNNNQSTGNYTATTPTPSSSPQAPYVAYTV